MVHQKLIELLKKALDEETKLSKEFKKGLKKQISNLPECVSFNTALETISGYAPLSINGDGNDPNYNVPACGTQSYCEALKKLGRCNKDQCFF